MKCRITSEAYVARHTGAVCNTLPLISGDTVTIHMSDNIGVTAADAARLSRQLGIPVVIDGLEADEEAPSAHAGKQETQGA